RNLGGAAPAPGRRRRAAGRDPVLGHCPRSGDPRAGLPVRHLQRAPCAAGAQDVAAPGVPSLFPFRPEAMSESDRHDTPEPRQAPDAAADDWAAALAEQQSAHDQATQATGPGADADWAAALAEQATVPGA